MDTEAIVVLTCAVSNVGIALIAVAGNHRVVSRVCRMLERPVREHIPRRERPFSDFVGHHKTDRLEDVDMGLDILKEQR